MKTENFLQIFPSRKSVKTVITKEAQRAKEAIKILFREAIKQNGFGCTLDLWTHKFKSDTGINQKSVVFHMGYVDDIVKSKQVIKFRVIDVFHDFEVSMEEMDTSLLVSYVWNNGLGVKFIQLYKYDGIS